jgi:hypothetical protein
MKKSILFLAFALIVSAGFAGYYYSTTAPASSPSKFSMLSEAEKADFLQSVNSDCTWNGISLKGKVQFVESFPDIKIQYVTSFPDLKVQWVTSFPDDCGEWQEVTSFPDFKVQVVTSFPDVQVQEVTSFPGL